MKLKIAALVAMIAGAPGCASMMDGGIPSPEELSALANTAYAGKHVDMVFSRFGQPSGQFDTDAGIRVLTWNTSNTMRFHEPVTTTTTGSVGDPTTYPYQPRVPYTETTTTQQGYNVDMSCTMQVGVRADGIVDRVAFNGKMGACQMFMPY